MEKITILGTGAAMVTKCYNTCFTLSNGSDHFLVDAGGGNTILANLEKTQIPIHKIHHVFISHSHNDHVTGIIWIIRAVAQNILDENYEGILTIYCHQSLVHIITTISNLLLQKKFTSFIGSRIVFEEIEDSSTFKVLNYNITFFDIQSTKHLQFGFTTTLENGKTLTFLGDEPYRNVLYNYAREVDYLLHESFCLYSQKDIFHPYEKFHATVKDACENAEILKVKTVLLYHSEDKNLQNRTELYIEEGRQYFKGEIIVPEDLEVVIL